MAVWASKLCAHACRLTGSKGSSAPGVVARWIYPAILPELARRMDGKTVAVCGTNGKTTTNNLLAALLRAQGMRVICNEIGSNMIAGVITAYLECCTRTGRVEADIACLEVDEAFGVHVLPHIEPDIVIVTNLFRDQLDRYGEIDITRELLVRALKKVPGAMLVLNGDDPLCASLCRTPPRVRTFFGVSEEVPVPTGGESISDESDAVQTEAREGRFCVFCHHELQYRYYHYSQLGDYFCEGCNFRRPTLDFAAREVRLDPHLAFSMNDLPVQTAYRGFYNVYNVLAALTVATLLEINLDDIDAVLASYAPQIGRMEEFVIDGMPAVLNLSKNPTGFNQTIAAMRADTRQKNVVVVVNDNDQDGTDISWIWDVDFEQMAEADAGFARFVASGIRAEDVALRMKYAEITPDTVLFEKDVRRVIEVLLRGEGEVTGKSGASRGEVLYVLVNYTPLFETQRVLLDLQAAGSAARADATPRRRRA